MSWNQSLRWFLFSSSLQPPRIVEVSTNISLPVSFQLREDWQRSSFAPGWPTGCEGARSFTALCRESRESPSVCMKKVSTEFNPGQQDTNFLPQGTEGLFRRVPSVCSWMTKPVHTKSGYRRGAEFRARGATYPRAQDEAYLATQHPGTEPLSPQQLPQHIRASPQDAGLRQCLLKSPCLHPSRKF